MVFVAPGKVHSRSCFLSLTQPATLARDAKIADNTNHDGARAARSRCGVRRLAAAVRRRGSPWRLRRRYIRRQFRFGTILRHCSRLTASARKWFLTRHTIPSRIPSNSLKTKDGAPFYPSRKRSPFRTLDLAGASHFPYNLCTHFTQGDTCTRPLTTAFARRCATISASVTRRTCPS